MYLANDVIQNSKKKGPEYSRDFLKVLKLAFRHIFECCASDTKTISALLRILSIWEDRSVYESKIVKEFRRELQPSEDEANENSNDGAASSESNGAAAAGGKRKGDGEREVAKRAKTHAGESGASAKERIKSETIEVNGTKETHVILSQHVPAGKWTRSCWWGGVWGVRIIELICGITIYEAITRPTVWILILGWASE